MVAQLPFAISEFRVMLPCMSETCCGWPAKEPGGKLIEKIGEQAKGLKVGDRVGVVGIGGLGHLALQFLNAWGCEATAFTSSPSIAAEAEKPGAHHGVDSTGDGLKAIAGTLDFILVRAGKARHRIVLKN